MREAEPGRNFNDEKNLRLEMHLFWIKNTTD